MGTAMNGDLNNTAAERVRAEIVADSAYRRTSLAIPASEDDASIRKAYRPFLLDDIHSDRDWVAGLELSTILKMIDLQILKSGGERLKVLVLYGSMRER
jgi:arsenic resistance protein ArsH